MSQALPPPPYKAPVSDKTGMLSNAWSKWFQIAFVRMGGSSALSNTELESATTPSIATLQTQVASLQDTGGDFNQGTVL